MDATLTSPCACVEGPAVPRETRDCGAGAVAAATDRSLQPVCTCKEQAECSDDRHIEKGTQKNGLELYMPVHM